MSELSTGPKVTFSISLPKKLAAQIGELAKSHRPAVSRTALIAFVLESWVADQAKKSA